jgi:hypothetical protein|tara:strand:- start:390 stop:524 length:135 start_codon:yes stop_codon:yes gene_type:complete
MVLVLVVVQGHLSFLMLLLLVAAQDRHTESAAAAQEDFSLALLR